MMVLVLIFINGCGTETKVIEVPSEPGPGGNTGGNAGGNTGKTTFPEARQLIGEYCEGCHANSPWLRNEASLRRSSVLSRTKNGSMPPANSSVKMGNAARQKLINFF